MLCARREGRLARQEGGEQCWVIDAFDDEVEAELRSLTDLAPLHQPKSLDGIDATRSASSVRDDLMEAMKKATNQVTRDMASLTKPRTRLMRAEKPTMPMMA